MIEDRELVEEFVVESLEHLEAIEPILLEMEKTGSSERETLNEVFRAIHSIKGAAGFLGLGAIQSLSHAMESLLMRLRDGLSQLRPDMCDPLLSGVEKLSARLRNLPDSESETHDDLIAVFERLLAEEEGSSASVDAPQSGLPTPRVEKGGMRFGEIAVDLGLLAPDQVTSVLEHQRSSDIKRTFGMTAVAQGLLNIDQVERIRAEQMIRLAQATRADAPPPSTPATDAAGTERRLETIRVSVPLLDKLMDLAGELVLGRNQLRQALEGVGDAEAFGVFQSVDRVTTELQDNIMNTRMQPMRVVFDKLPRLVRDVSRKLGKRAEVVLTGGDVELDRSILEALSDPLNHLLRNSVDHGLETPEGRRAATKPDTGRITVRAYHESGQVVVEIADDGKGIDPERIKRSALDKGAITQAEADAMTPREALGLIFLAGLSTAEKVTDVSGRGVGMDVVRTNIRNLGGQIELDSEVGRGTTVRIQLPLTLAIIPSFIVSVAGERFAIPQVNLVEVVRLREDDASQLDRVRGAEVLHLRGALVPLLRLDAALGVERGAAPMGSSVVVLRTGSRSYGLVVDELHDNEEIVVKPLSSFVKRCTWFAGATILGDGSVAMIVDAQGLARHAGLSNEGLEEAGRKSDDARISDGRRRSYLIFGHAEDEQFALPLEQLARLERIETGSIERVAGREFLQCRDRTIPLVRLESVLPVGRLDSEPESLYVLIPRVADPVGFVARSIIDTIDTDVAPAPQKTRTQGLVGSAVVRERLTLFLDANELVEASKIERAA